MQSLLLNVLMHDCDEMITIKSLDLKYLDCNNAFMQHIGAKHKEDIVGKPIIDVIPISNYKIIKDKIDNILKQVNYNLILLKSKRIIRYELSSKFQLLWLKKIKSNIY